MNPWLAVALTVYALLQLLWIYHIRVILATLNKNLANGLVGAAQQRERLIKEVKGHGTPTA